jgi:hypothetical protein
MATPDRKLLRQVVARCRFRGHREKVLVKLENLDDEKDVQPRVETGSGGVDSEA